MNQGNCCCHREHLTPQEVSALELVASGLANEAIGHRLHLSGHTVAGQVSAAMRRLGAHSRAELVARSFVLGILEADRWPPYASGRRCLPDLPSAPSGVPGFAPQSKADTSTRAPA